MGNFFRQMNMRRSSQYLAVILAVFMLTGAVSGPVCAAYAAEADPTAAETWTDLALEENDADPVVTGAWTDPALEEACADPSAMEAYTDPAAMEEAYADPAAMEAYADPAPLEAEAGPSVMEAGADSAIIEAGADLDPAVPEAETDSVVTEADPDPALADPEAGPGLETQAEAGTEDRASENGQEIFTITYSANRGGYFTDTSWSDGQYIDFTETVGAGTVICSRNSADLAEGPFEYPSDYLSETYLSQTGDIEGAVYKIGTVALFADDGNEFLGWSLQEDGAEMIPEEGLDVSRDETVFAVWKQDDPDEEVRSDEGIGTGEETEAETGTETGTGTESEDGQVISTETENEADLFPETDPGTVIDTDPDTDPDVDMETGAEPGEPADAGTGEHIVYEAGKPAEAESGEHTVHEAGEPAEDETGTIPNEEISEEAVNSAHFGGEHDDQPAECTVTFDADGGQFFNGDGVLTETVREGAAIRLRDYEEPRKEGFWFSGWSLEKNGMQTVSDRRFRVTENVTLYAVWTEYKTITFNANGGHIGRREMSEKKVSFEAGERINLNDYEPRPAGWEDFKGWSLSKEGTELLPRRYTVTDSVTLYAI